MTIKIHFDEDLDVLRGKLLEMGGLCEDMIHDAVKVLTERDEVYLADVQTKEGRVNDLHIEIDELALRLIALHQPAAGDLRLIAAALKINSDLERIGDQAVNIAETGIYLACRASNSATSAHGGSGVGMTKDSLDAFSRRDVELARSVIARDDEEDALKSQTFNELVG